ncbi:hypothetical protein [Raineya orbicola]|uniref:Outer membrane protein beta-barrel domain n=1 Tax=Raineya orbicola TaxID=2016530 RepID=A0A2N3IC00_9BACT|nr:hypothetical protein [Raineya orbicola]PKQ67872.1 hypothetical protein Rain11_1890 [Raineya orbicola]
MKKIFFLFWILSHQLFAQKWFVNATMSWENIRRGKQTLIESKINIPNFIDTSFITKYNAGNGMGLQIQIEKTGKNLSFSTGVHFSPKREYSTERTFQIFFDDNRVLSKGEGIRKVTWQNEIEIPLKISYYFRFPKQSLMLIPSFSLLLGTTKNQVIHLIDSPYSFRSVWFNNTDFFIKRLTYQADLSLGYQINDKSTLTLGYFFQKDMISQDEPYLLRGIRFGIKQQLD